MTSPAFRVRPLREDRAFGVIVEGLELTALHDEAVRRRLRELWIRSGVIVFPDVEGENAHVELSQCFGSLVVHPIVEARSKNPESVTTVVPEKFRAFNNRIRATWANGDKGKEAQLQLWAQELADKIIVDPSPSVRQSATTKGDLAKADDILSKEPEAIEAKVEKMLAMVPDYDLGRDEDGKPERLSLARLISKWIDAMITA